MDFSFLLFSAALAPFFASRLFVTAFTVSLMARLYENGWFDEAREWMIFAWLQLDFDLQFQPWLTSDGTILLLAVAALVELYLEKHPDLSEALSPLSPIVRPPGKLILETTAVKATVTVGAVAVAQAGWADHIAIALIMAGATAVLAWLRNGIVQFLYELDEGDDTGLRKLISWAEDGWVAFGVTALFIAPVLALVAAGLSALTLVSAQAWFRYRDEKQKQACPQCGTANYRSAVDCRQCGHAFTAPARIGLFGQPKHEAAADLDRHRLMLLTKKRCARCATRLSSKTLRQDCPGCGAQMFPDEATVQRYAELTDARLGKTLGIVALFGLIPIFGIIPGLIYGRMNLIANWRGYVPMSAGCLLRWLSRIFKLILLLFQWAPLLGALLLALRCWIDHLLYRAAFMRERAKRFG